jgi:peroxiredoxin Q/BCP
MALIAAGADAPEIESVTSRGDAFRLSDLRGKIRAMLIFYPKDFTPGCTDQLTEVRNNVEFIREVATEPIGVNPGDAESHEKFRKTYDMTFDLLVDEDRAIARAYGTLKDDGESIQRAVVVVGKDGKVIFAEEGAPPWQVVCNAIRAANDETPA